MRITESQIRRIIREEARNILEETITRKGPSSAMRYFMTKRETEVEHPHVNHEKVSLIKNAISAYFSRRKEKADQKPGETYIAQEYRELSPEVRGNLDNPDYTDFLMDIARVLKIKDFTYVDLDAALEITFSDF